MSSRDNRRCEEQVVFGDGAAWANPADAPSIGSISDFAENGLVR
jgi:hypothetical protein